MAPFFSLVHEVQSPRRPDGASVPMDLVALALSNQSLDFGTLPRIACGNGLLGLISAITMRVPAHAGATAGHQSGLVLEACPRAFFIDVCLQESWKWLRHATEAAAFSGFAARWLRQCNTGW